MTNDLTKRLSQNEKFRKIGVMESVYTLAIDYETKKLGIGRLDNQYGLRIIMCFLKNYILQIKMLRIFLEIFKMKEVVDK